MAARTKTKVSPKYKTKYRVKNWAAYDISLRDRGDITVWFDDEAICAWNALPNGRPGGTAQILRSGACNCIDLEDSLPPAAEAD